VVIAVAACKGRVEKQTAVVPPTVGSGSAALAAGSGSATPAKPHASKEQLADYRKHMKAGWTLQKQEKWADAVPEFEAALKAVDVDPRALTELGWSAMNAGDYKKARRADDQAVRLAIEPKVKAAALYNLGLVEAKTGNADDARQSFTASLALRPNKTVEAELAKLGAAPEQDVPLCQPGQDPCTCLRSEVDPEGGSETECTPVTEPKNPVAAFKAYDVKATPWTYRYLLDERGDLVAIINQQLDRMRVTEDLSLDKIELKTLGGHSLLWIETVDTAEQTDYADDDSSSKLTHDTIRQVTLCLVGDAKTPTHCPVRGLPLESTHSEDHMGEGKQPPSTSKTARLALALGDNGTANVTVPKGASDEGLESWVGPHTLW